jgi:hypothetical protein
MTEEQIALAKRAVACKGWRFMGGMLVSDAIGKQRIYDDVAGEPYWSTDEWLPVLEDPATLGCLLALVREAHGPRCYTQACGGFWTVQNEDTEDWWGKNCVYEVEALVAALEAAP